MTGPWKAWKTNYRFSTFPSSARDDDDDCLSKPKNQRKEDGRYAASSFFIPLSLRPGQTDFMLILQLENAAFGSVTGSLSLQMFGLCSAL